MFFFELGIRTALNRPVSLVRDDLTKEIPFDTSILNYHTYKSQPTWELDNEITKLSEHIEDCIKSSNGQNSMWEKFGISLAKPSVPENLLEAKIDLLSEKINSIQKEDKKQDYNQYTIKKDRKNEKQITELVQVLSEQIFINVLTLEVDTNLQHVFILIPSDVDDKRKEQLRYALELRGISASITSNM